MITSNNKHATSLEILAYTDLVYSEMTSDFLLQRSKLSPSVSYLVTMLLSKYKSAEDIVYMITLFKSFKHLDNGDVFSYDLKIVSQLVCCINEQNINNSYSIILYINSLHKNKYKNIKKLINSPLVHVSDIKNLVNVYAIFKNKKYNQPNIEYFVSNNILVTCLVHIIDNIDYNTDNKQYKNIIVMKTPNDNILYSVISNKPNIQIGDVVRFYGNLSYRKFGIFIKNIRFRIDESYERKFKIESLL